jgi:hypothetical protein
MEAENDEENRIIREIFDRENALKIAVKLECLIAEMQLDEGFGQPASFLKYDCSL